MKVKNIIQTCGACPSQWEGTLEDGRMFYARYRWGGLSVRISEKSTNDSMEAVRGKEVLYENIGDGYDGVLDQSVLVENMTKVGFIF